MKVLVETLPDHEQVASLDASVVLGDSGHQDDIYVADEAIARVLDGRETRTNVFSEEELVALKGLERALKSGDYDTSGSGIQVIPAAVSKPLLTAMDLYEHIPDEEQAHLTDTEKHKWSIAVEALRSAEIVELDPGVSTEEALVNIVPEAVKPVEPETHDDGLDYEWLYTPSDKKLNGLIPKPSLFANRTLDEDANTGMRLFKEKPLSEVSVGVGVPELLAPDVPILPKDHVDVANTPAKSPLSAEMRALSLEDTQDGTPAVKHDDSLAKR